MLVIRMQRTGRKGHAQFRVVVQDSRRTPSSGRIVANLGSFNPHTKQTTLNKEKAEYYLSNGAQPSDRVIRLLKAEKVKLPKWVKEPTVKKRELKNAEKLRKKQPTQAETVDEVQEPSSEAPAEENVETTTEESAETEEKTTE